MQKHRVFVEGDNRFRFYGPEDVIPMMAGVQVEGTHSSEAGFVNDILNYAYSMGTVSRETYAALMSDVQAAHMDDEDALEALTDIRETLIESLNEANTSEGYSWGVHESDLHYQSENWWAE